MRSPCEKGDGSARASPRRHNSQLSEGEQRWWRTRRHRRLWHPLGVNKYLPAKLRPPASDQNASTTEPESSGSPFTAPKISLPKGGGAIRGIDEKFTANPVTGTGSLSVPLALSPGRSGFGPQLSLDYDSSAGNGIFGMGWSLSLPSIVRRTDKGTAAISRQTAVSG